LGSFGKFRRGGRGVGGGRPVGGSRVKWVRLVFRSMREEERRHGRRRGRPGGPLHRGMGSFGISVTSWPDAYTQRRSTPILPLSGIARRRD
jgi:hypothetical protein